MVLEKNLPLAKGVIGSASVEILRSDQSPKIMSVTWAFEKPEDIKILDQFAEKYVMPYRKKLAPKTTTYTGEVVAKIEFWNCSCSEEKHTGRWTTRSLISSFA